MKPSQKLLAAIALLSASGTSMYAQNLTWGGTGSTTTTSQYNLATNWSGNTAVPAGTSATTLALFTNLGNSTVTMSANQTARLTFQGTGSYTVTGGSINVGSGGDLINLISTNAADQQVNSDLYWGSSANGNNIQIRNTSSTARTLTIGTLGGSDGRIGGQTVVAGLTTQLSLTGASGVQNKIVFNGVIADIAPGRTGTGNLMIQGNSANVLNLTFNAANTFSGGLEFNGGTTQLTLGNKTALGTGALVTAGGSVTINANTALTGANKVMNDIRFNGTASTVAGTTSVTYTGVGSNTVTVSDPANLAVGQALTYINGPKAVPNGTYITAISGGNITLSNAVPTGASTTAVGAGTGRFTAYGSGTSTTVFDGTNAIEFGGTVYLGSERATAGTATQTFNVTNTGGVTFSGNLVQQNSIQAGNGLVVGALTKTGAGTLTLAGTNSYTGATAINGGTLQLNSAQPLGGNGTVASIGTVSFGGGTLQFTANNTTDYSSRFSGSANQPFSFDTNGQNVTLATQLTASSGGSLTKLGAGTLILTGTTPAFTGTTTISGGTLQLGNNGTTGRLPSGSAIVNNGTLFFNRSNNVAQGTDFSNTLSGNGSLVFSAQNNSYAQSQLTSATNSYTGTTTISNGYLNVGANSILSGVAGPMGNSTSAIIIGDANTVASTYIGSGPNAILLVTGANDTNPNTYSITRNIDSSGAANVAGRNDIGFNSDNTGAISTLTISGNWALNTGNVRNNGLWAQRAGQTLDFTGVISGGNSSTSFRAGDLGQGAGNIRLSNASNSYVSKTLVSAGTLLIAGDAGASSGVLGTNSGLAVGDFTGQSAAALTDGAYTVGKTINLADIGSAANTWTLGGNQAAVSSFTGNITTSSLAYSATLNLSQVASGTTTFSGVISANPNGANVINVAKIGSGTVVLTGTNTYDGTTTITAGSLQLGNGGTKGTASTGDITNNANLTINRSNAAVQGTDFGTITSGTGSFTQAGAGTTTLNVANSYTGGTLVTGGTLLVSNSTGSGTGSGDVSVSSGATLGGNGTVSGNVGLTSATLGSGSTFAIGGNLTSDGASSVALSSTVNVAGTTSVASGTLTVNGTLGVNGTIGGAGTVAVSSTGSLTGNATINNATTVSGGTLGTTGNTLNLGSTLGASGTNLIASNVIVNVTGTTTISSGVFNVNGTLGGAGAKIVGNTATLKGNGIIQGLTTVQSGGTLAPGNSPGLETFTDGLTLDAGSTFVFDLNDDTSTGRGTVFDGVNVTGGTFTIAAGTVSFNIVLNGSGSSTDFTDAFWSSSQSWLVFDNANTPTISGSFVVGAITADTTSAAFGTAHTANGVFGFSQTGNDIYLNYTYTPVPEPSTYAAVAGLGAIGLALYRRRRTSVKAGKAA